MNRKAGIFIDNSRVTEQGGQWSRLGSNVKTSIEGEVSVVVVVLYQ